MKIKKKR